MNIVKMREGLGRIQRFFTQASETLGRNLLTACERVDESAAKGIMSELLRVSEAKKVCEVAMADLGTESEVPVYILSTMFVQDAFRLLTQGPEEDLRFATGLVTGPNILAVTRLLQFDMKLRSVIAAQGDQASVTRVLIYLHNHDHKLFMTWHSHPGSGKGATTPSSTDIDFHRRLELGGYPVIGAICSRQGYVRFFSYRRAFKVSVYGKGMEVIDEQHSIFRLTSISTVQG